MKTLFVTALALIVSQLAHASTDPKQVDKIDRAREGNLAELAINYFKANVAVKCEAGLEEPKFDSVKVYTDSSNEDKKPDTEYNYSATYLVVQKCLSGSTYVGAYSSPVKAGFIKGSFHSKYNAKRGPAKMLDLTFQFLKEIDVTVPQE